MKTKAWIINAIGAALLVGLAPAQASAYYYDSVPGSACQAYYPSTYVYSTNLYHEGNGIVNSDPSQAKFVQCPIQRVNASSSTGLYYGEIGMYDPSSTHSLWCSIESYDLYGNYVAGTNLNSTATSTGTWFLNIPATASVYAGFYSLFCVLPPGGSSVNSYFVVEK